MACNKSGAPQQQPQLLPKMSGRPTEQKGSGIIITGMGLLILMISISWPGVEIGGRGGGAAEEVCM